MVAVRLARLAVPDLKVKVALPSVPVVAVAALTIPVSVDKDTIMLGSAAFEAFSAVRVMVVIVELSDVTVVDEAESCSVAAVDTTCSSCIVVVLLAGTPPSPQPERVTNKAANKAIAENL